MAWGSDEGRKPGTSESPFSIIFLPFASRQGKMPGVSEDYSPDVLRGVFPVDCPVDLVDFPADFFRGEYFVYESPVPGAPTVYRVPLFPTVTCAPLGPKEKEIPLLLMFKYRPGRI